jgi:poly-gamma-glutamate capsule biosynthesis protein CapA/YwtB (metallophosphatase superfamily)
MSEDTITLLAVGDILPNRVNPESIFAATGSFLRKGDLTFGNLESPYAESGTPGPSQSGAVPHDPKNLAALTYAGFDVVSMANNHVYDWGAAALLEAMERVKRLGIAISGVGRNIEEARKPVIVERKGTRVAFLSYGCIGPPGYEAEVDKPGFAPVRVITHYEPYVYQPGNPAKIFTYAITEDLEAMVEDIKSVKPLADVVVATYHWGLYHVRASLAMYQQEIAYAALDAGADLILGHHPHILKGIEVYKGKAIVHSLANFAVEHREPDSSLSRAAPRSSWATVVRQLFPGVPFPDQRKTIILKCIISNKSIAKVSFLPCLIKDDGEPEILPQRDEKSEEVFRYMVDISREAGLDTAYSWDRDDVVVTLR